MFSRICIRRLRADREFVLEAVKQNGCVFEYVSEEFRADKEIILAVKSNGGALYLDYASKELRADKEIILEVTKSIYPGILFLSL